MQKQTAVAVGIDVGSTHVRVVVGALGEDQTVPTVIGAGSSDTGGMRKGSVISVQDVTYAIERALQEAERVSGNHITAGSVSVNGNHIKGLNSKGHVAISNNNLEITMDDMLRVEEDATVVQLPPNREILQVFAKSYSLDGQENIKEPLGMNGRRLEVDALIVTAATPALKNLDRAIENAQIHSNHHIVAGIASAEAVLDDKQRESGTVVIDFGAGTTNIAVYEEDDLQHVAVLPVGSNNLTNDLAIGLRTDLDIAEDVKLSHARAADDGKKKDEEVDITKDDEVVATFKQRDIDLIVHARLEEMFDMIDQELKKIHRSRKLPGGVVLVGGGANLPHLEEYVKSKLELPARVAKPRNYSGIIDATDDPAFACAVGLMMLDMSMAAYAPTKSAIPGFNLGGILGGVGNFLKKFKP